MIELSDVSFSYEHSDQGVLDHVSLSIKPGECVLFCGESGCGKTTITRLLNGLIPHFYEGKLEGEIRIDGLNVREEELYTIAEKVGSVFQNPRSQFFCLDTTSEIAFGCENMGLPEAEILGRLEQVKEELEMDPLMDRNLFQLSGGEKQRVACASVSAMRPDILVLDEPTSNLDLDAIETMRKTLKLWKQQGKTIVVAEHRIYWLKEICDRVIYLKDGKIQWDLSMEAFQKLLPEEIKELGLRNLTLPEIKRKEAEKDSKTDAPKENMRLQQYRFSYGKKEILHLEDMEIPQESVIAVTGHNGAGKSTFLRCMCGLEKKFKGKTLLNGQRKDRRKMLKECYMVMQDVNHQLFCETVEDEIRLGMREDLEEKVPELIKALDLEGLEQRHPMSLSGGQKQRVAIASAILAGKSVLIFDEPTSGLDYRHMVQTALLFRTLRQQKITTFIITHDPELIQRCCTHVFHIENGQKKEFYEISNQGQR